jgi:Kinesin motor domain
MVADENDEEQQSPSSLPQYKRLASTSSIGSRSLSTEDDASAMSALLTTGDSSIKVTIPRSPDSCVQVAVRVRPLLSSLESGCGSCMTILPGRDYATAIQVGPTTGPTFTFDEVFPASTTQVQVFEHRVAPLVDRCLEGYNATILAYGQTGSGKLDFGLALCRFLALPPVSQMVCRILILTDCRKDTHSDWAL